eukprot:COSAG01_NODE_56477_length_318_cov_0.707763_1_plen_25_part_01
MTHDGKVTFLDVPHRAAVVFVSAS